MPRFASRRPLPAALLALAAFLLLAGTASAATFTVNTTADTTVAGGCTTDPSCSLRDAVNAANGAAGDDTVSVPAGHYVLTTGALTPNSALTITGAGARTTSIDAGGASRVIQNGTANAALTLQGLTITGGAAGASSSPDPGDGGGIYFQGTGTLTLSHVAVVGNTATLGGGGIFAPFEAAGQVVSIDSSTVSGNTVTGGAVNGQGGGIAVFGTLTVTSSTISGNSISTPGIAEGGGIASAKDSTDATTTPRPLTLVNTTIAGNTLAGATNFGAGVVGDNIDVAAFNTELVATNTIVAGNTAAGTPQDCALVNTTTTDHNLSSDSTCGFADAGSIQNADPKLGPLADNGGDTDTLALLGGSPAINAGTNSGCPAADQRGTTRPQVGVCDIGAFELVFQADLAITKVAAPEPIVAGDNVTYTITVTNNGPQPAAGVTVSDPLPGGTTFVSSSLGSACAGAPLVCTLPDLASGAQNTFTIVARTSVAGTISNTATVSGLYADPNSANNSASATSRVRARTADLGVKASASPKVTKIGRRVVFTLAVSNAGADSATGAKVALRLSTGLRFLSGTKGCKRTGTVVTCTLGTIKAKGKRTLRISTETRRAGKLSAKATVRATQTDPKLGNNRSTARVTVKAAKRARHRSAPVFTG